MVRSLQELVDFVLNEVALCGSHGATLSDVLQAIEAFYRPTQDQPQRTRQNVDQRFKSKVWSWLTRNPEVSVGNDKEFNHLTLDELKKLDAGITKNATSTNATNEHQLSAADSEQNSAPTSHHVRMFVSEKRTWLAVAGHEPDDVRVPYSEYALLSIIASTKSEGIPQTELVRRSNQDKRSVPKRTDALQKKGYIEKRNIQVRGSRTSLCILRRFANVSNEEQKDQKSEKRVMMDFDHFIDKLFEILKKHKIIVRNDLKNALGFEDLWHWRILSRALRKFERIGVLRRVKAKSQYSKYHPCVELLRQPTPLDLEMFHEYSRDDISRSTAGEADLEDDDELEPEASIDKPGETENQFNNVQKDHVVGEGRIIPSWTPDRNMCNQIFEVVDNAGPVGITNMHLNRVCYGHFYKRPSEALMSRLVNCWQISQPPELRQFSIVRDTDVKKTVLYYVHYSFRHFETRVERGTGFWEAVVYPSDKLKDLHVPAIDAAIEVDEYGLPKILPYGLLRNGNVTRFEGLSICNVADYKLTGKDPMPFIREDGSYCIAPWKKPPSGCKQYLHIKPQGVGRPKGSLNKVLGRPRGSRNKAKSSKRKRSASVESVEDSPTTPQRSDNDENEQPSEYGHQSVYLPISKKSKNAQYRGMPKKERYEAMGMDMTWTEYSSLVIEKPGPGVYVTPLGRKRAAGKARGRPRTSRIAIFKSSRLTELPWFTKDHNSSDEEDVAASQGPATPSILSQTTPAATAETPATSKRPASRDPSEDRMETPSRSTRNKRKKADLSTGEASAPVDTPSSSTHEGRHSTRRASRSATTDAGLAADLPVTNPALSVEDDVARVDGRTLSTRPRSESIDEGEERSRKRTRVDRGDKTPTNGKGKADASQLMPPPPPKSATPKARTPSVRVTPSIGRKPTKNSVFQKPHAMTERSGTVNILRRKIVMQIVEDAGGAYPGGNELWYPFLTKWGQLNYKERPDTRTIRAAVKQLVDAGQLKRVTFGGRDAKGVMVTKEVLRKSDVPADSPIVKEMKDKLLDCPRTDASTVFSPQVPTNAPMGKNKKQIEGSIRGGQIKNNLPKISHTTVQILKKPAYVLIEERRRAQKLERDLQKRLARDMDGYTMFESGHGSGVQRLMSLNRPAGLRVDTWRYPGKTGLSKRLIKTMSTIGPMAMMMNPEQVFDPTNGTFSTISMISDRRRGKKARFFSSIDPEAAVDDLLGLIESTQSGVSTNTVYEEDAAAEQHYNFFQTADRVCKWEIYYEDVFTVNLQGMPFIDLTVNPKSFYSAPIQSRSSFLLDHPPPPLAPARKTSRNLTHPYNQGGKYRRILPAYSMPVWPLQDPHTPYNHQEMQFQNDVRRARRPRTLATLPEGQVRKFMVAIVAVRTLAGGNDGKVVEWELVQKAFPANQLEFVQAHGKSIIARNRMEILKMQSDFQERFLEAYERNQVPAINYDDLSGYNWQALVEWATIELDFSTSEKAPTLPATREQFDSVFEYREDAPDLSHDLYFTGAGTTILHKRHLMTRIPFVVEQPHLPEPRKKTDRTQLEVAKTWVRANIFTPEGSYDSTKAAEELQKFESFLSSATQSLLNDRIISSTNKGRPVPGRNYIMHDTFAKAMERRGAIDSDQLRQAMSVKADILDPAFQKGETVKIEYFAGDGYYLAIDELVAHKHVEVVPIDAPRSKFGLVDGYMTRQMDRNKLRFQLEVRPLSSYYQGNPIHDEVSNTIPPKPTTDNKIPLWFDIHGCLIQDLWEKSIAAVIGSVLLRPGVNADSIAAMIKPVLFAWEVSLLLEDWLLKVGAVRRSGEGKNARWTTEESWWFVLG